MVEGCDAAKAGSRMCECCDDLVLASCLLVKVPVEVW